MNKTMRTGWRIGVLCAALLGPAAGWAFDYECSANTDGATLTYAGSPVDSRERIWVKCWPVREPSAWLWYRIKADLGSNAISASPFRTVRRVGSTQRLAYALRMGDYYSATCGDTTDWLAPDSGNANVLWGNLYFYAPSIYGTTVFPTYCLRVVGPPNPWAPMPAAGVYQDQFRMTVEFTGTGQGTTQPSIPGSGTPPIILTVPVVVHVASHCRLEPRQERLNLHYTSFSREDGVASTQALLACSEGQHWSAAINPPGGTLLGLAYTLSLHMPNTGAPLTSGVSTGMAQQIDIVGRIAAGQTGSCGTGQCTASQTHTLTISY